MRTTTRTSRCRRPRRWGGPRNGEPGAGCGVGRDADVRFRDGRLEVYDETGKKLYTLEPSETNKSLPPGKYMVKVSGADGLKVNTPEFRLEKGGKTKVHVVVDTSWRPGGVAK